MVGPKFTGPKFVAMKFCFDNTQKHTVLVLFSTILYGLGQVGSRFFRRAFTHEKIYVLNCSRQKTSLNKRLTYNFMYTLMCIRLVN